MANKTTAQDLAAATFATVALANKAIKTAGGVNYLDPCTHNGIGSGTMKVRRNVFTMPCGAILETSKRRGCAAKVADNTQFYSYWAGSITASSAAKYRAGDVTVIIAG